MQLQLWGRKEEVPPGSHLCQLYTKSDEVNQVAVALFTAAAANRCRCLYIGPTEMIEAVEANLTKSRIPVAQLRESGQFVVAVVRDQHLPNNRFDPYHLLSTHQSFIRQAQIDGWDGVLVGVDMSWLCDSFATNSQILKYEALCDAVFTFQNQPIIAVAQYGVQKLGPDMQIEMNKLHPQLLVGQRLRRNPMYVNSEQYFMSIVRASKQHTAATARGN